MTPAQSALKQYLFAKLQEGTFAGLSAPGEMLKKAILEVVADAPAAFGDLLGGTIGAVVLSKAGDIARDASKRGILVVLGELKDSLDMQYQRGVERQRKRR
jgi:hypothetical protein